MPPPQPPGELVFEPGSFRDRTNRVFYLGDEVLRGLNARAVDNWRALSARPFFRRFVAEEKIIRTHSIEPAGLPAVANAAGWAGVLAHARIPFVSYPYEWSFGMLKAAARLHLELLDAALADGLTVKDATPYNIQWIGAHPVFIDVASFEPLTPGEPWIAYRQFCEMFLYPLLLQAYRDVPFQPWMRGRLDGIDAAHCMRLLGRPALLRRGVLSHVYLQAKAQARFADTTRHVRRDLSAAGFHRDLIRANVRRLSRLIDRLSWTPQPSAWSSYTTDATYAPADRDAKAAFVRDAITARSWRLAWDLGCNDGTFSHLAADAAATVVAFDADAVVIERLYHARRNAADGRRILPLITNLADPAPGLGWRGMERKPLTARGAPDLVLCLALIHHIVLGANVPLVEFLDWLRELDAAIVIEFVDRSDAQVATLLRNKRDDFVDYERGLFERELTRRFDVGRRLGLAGGARQLYFGMPR
jgi:SAM-dependent methyltransferase